MRALGFLLLVAFWLPGILLARLEGDAAFGSFAPPGASSCARASLSAKPGAIASPYLPGRGAALEVSAPSSNAGSGRADLPEPAVADRGLERIVATPVRGELRRTTTLHGPIQLRAVGEPRAPCRA